MTENYKELKDKLKATKENQKKRLKIYKNFIPDIGWLSKINKI